LFFPYILYLYLKDSDTGKNMYGDNPKEVRPNPNPSYLLTWKITFNNGIARILMDNSSIIIGRSTESDIIIDNKYVSSQHCIVMIEKGQINIRDFGSRNGTYIGSKKLTQNTNYNIFEGEEVLVGSGEIRFNVQSNLKN
jgi:pSer/pThr/pTyr-binding forkhead associated (FHA) protein